MSPFSVPMMMLCGNSPVLTQLLSSLRADTQLSLQERSRAASVIRDGWHGLQRRVCVGRTHGLSIFEHGKLSSVEEPNSVFHWPMPLTTQRETATYWYE